MVKILYGDKIYQYCSNTKINDAIQITVDNLGINENKYYGLMYNGIEFTKYMPKKCRSNSSHKRLIEISNDIDDGKVVTSSCDSLNFSDLFNISFERSIRIPVDDNVYRLPPSFGSFKLYSTNAPNCYAFHMYQREAMWIRIMPIIGKKYAIKVNIGNVNAVTGDLIDQQNDSRLIQDPQNYLTYGQPWLDGFKISQGRGTDLVRQFVAAPIDSSDSLEQQLFDTNLTDEINSVITIQAYQKLKLHDYVFVRYQSTLNICQAETEYLTVSEVPTDDDLYYFLREGKISNDTTFEDYGLIDETVELIPSTVNYMQIFVKTGTGKQLVIACRPNNTISDIKKIIFKMEGIPCDKQRIVYSHRQLDDHKALALAGHKTLADYNISDSTTLHIIIRLRGGGHSDNLHECVLSPGGYIKQKIYQDSSDVRRYTKVTECQIRILNSKHYYEICGNYNTSKTPISYQTYVKNGFPWYEMYDEKYASTNCDSNILDLVEGLSDEQH